MAQEASAQANRSGMDPRRLMVIFLIGFGIVFALFLQHLLSLAWAQFGWSNPQLVEGLEGWTLTTLLGVLVTAALMIFAFVNPRSHAVGMEIASELMKVTWPGWEETRVSTVAVVVASVIAAVLLFAIDTVAFKLMVEWLPIVWGKL